MIDIEGKSGLKYLMFGSLYFSEGLEYALAVVIVPVYLVDKGFSLALTTLIAGAVMAPWMLKFIFGGVVDYFSPLGRKRFILLGGVMGVSGLFAISFIDPSVSLLLFTLALLISHCGVVFFDVSADALAIEISREEERGKINGAMFAGLFIGMAAGSSLIGAIADSAGYSVGFFTTGILVLLIIIFPLLVKENILAKTRQKVASLLMGEFRKKVMQMVAVFLPISAISYGILQFAVPLYMKTTLDLNIATIGLITALFPAANVVGALVGGATTDKWGRKQNIYLFMILLSLFSALLVVATSWQRLAVLYGIVGFVHGGFYAAIGALLMDVTNPKIGATQYSLLTSLANFGEMGAGTATGALISAIGFGRVFLISGWIYGPALLIFYFVRYGIQIPFVQSKKEVKDAA